MKRRDQRDATTDARVRQAAAIRRRKTRRTILHALYCAALIAFGVFILEYCVHGTRGKELEAATTFVFYGSLWGYYQRHRRDR